MTCPEKFRPTPSTPTPEVVRTVLDPIRTQELQRIRKILDHNPIRNATRIAILDRIVELRDDSREEPFWPVKIPTAGCGDVGPLGYVCKEHLSEVDFDGFTVNWHVLPDPIGRGKAMWHNGPVIRP